MTPLLLGVDVGTSRIKASLVTPAGTVVRTVATPTPFAVSSGGTEMTAQAFRAAVARLLHELGDDRRRVAAAGVASMGESGTLLGRDGRLTGVPILAWHDPRGADTVARLILDFGPDLRRRTGRVPRAATTVAKLGWLRDQGAPVAGDWLGVAGLVVWWLTGAVAQEHSLAATSGAFDPLRRVYLGDVLDAAGLAGTRLPPPTPAGSAAGRVHRDGARWSGLPLGVPVTIAGHDHLVGALGAGATSEDVVDSMGTGEPLVVVWPVHRPAGLSELLDAADGETTLSPWPAGAEVAVLWEGLRPGIALATAQGRLGADREVLERLAAAAGPVEPVPIPLLRALEGGDADAVPAGARTDPGAFWAALLEACAQVSAGGERLLRTRSGRAGATIAIGGGVRSPRWLAAKRARATHPLVVGQEPEAVSRGAALLAGAAAGWWPAQSLPAPTSSGDEDPGIFAGSGHGSA